MAHDVEPLDGDPQLQRNLSLDGVMTRVMEGLTGGAVLAGLLLALGAGEIVIGLAAATPFLAQIAQLGALRLAFWWRSRRQICLTAAFASRMLLMVGGVVTVLLPNGAGLIVLVATLALSSTAAAIAAFSWAYWMRDLVPAAEYGRVFARRFAWQSAFGLGATVGAGAFLSWAGVEARLAFGLLFALGGLAGIAGLLFVRRLPEVPLNPADRAESPIGLARRALSKEERPPLAFAMLWGLASTIAIPFVPVFLLSELRASFLLAAALSASSVLAALATAGAWGRLTDRVGCKPVLAFAALASSVSVLGLVLVEDLSWRGIAGLAAVHVIMGAGLAAVEIALGKLVARSAPFNRAGGFLASAGLARALGAGLGVLLGGLFAAAVGRRTLTAALEWSGDAGATRLLTVVVAHYDFVFIASALLMIYASHRVLALDEPDARADVHFLRELHVELSGLAPFRGARSVARFAHHAGRLVRERRDPKIHARPSEPREAP